MTTLAKQRNGEPTDAVGSSDLVATPAPKREMSMMMWYATEGGRKCPMCGRYAKQSELGNLGGWYDDGHVRTRITAYGHKEGYGCNK